MDQSVYTTLSKSIGLQGDPIDLPNLEEAERLHKAVVDEQSPAAFEEIFKLYRFGKPAQSFQQQEVASLIQEAFSIGSKHFR